MTHAASRLEITAAADGVLTLRGAVDAHTAGQLETSLVDVADQPEVRLDMADVTFLDSSGLRVVIAAQKRLDEAERRLVLRSPSEVVLRLIEITGLRDHIRVE